MSVPLDPGTTLNNRYRIERLHKLGSMGAVYLAFDPLLGSNVAVKENLRSGPEYERQFHREAQFLVELNHPNIPRATDFFVLEGQGQYLVMPFIEGETADEWTASHSPSPPELILSMRGVFEALAYLHSQTPPVIHRDVEPANIIVSNNLIPFLVDFGLAKVLPHQQSAATGTSGSALALSPPQQDGWGRNDTRTDQYSLAAALYTLMTRQIPANSLQRALGNEVLEHASMLNPAIPRYVETALRRALSIKAKDRYSNIDTFWHALVGEV